MTDDVLDQLRQGMYFLYYAANSETPPQRATFNDLATAKILPCIPALSGRSDYDHLLEDAAQAGAVEIIRALPIRDDESRAHLTAKGWNNVVSNLPVEAYGDVDQRGLVFDPAAIVAIGKQGTPEAHACLQDRLARTHWRFGADVNTFVLAWRSLPCTEIAVSFAKAQMEAFPEKADALYQTTISASHTAGPFLGTLALESLLGRDQKASLTAFLRSKNPSNHQRLALAALCKDPWQMHRALRAVYEPTPEMTGRMIDRMLGSRLLRTHVGGPI